VDGIFGPITQSRVEDFQTDNNLIEDGFVGPETWQKLIIQVQQGKTGQEVRAVQRLLKDKFGYNVNVDGIFGPDTTNAVKQFQTAKGLTSDGIVGPKTWQKLIEK
jgi:zinc D-Ala-D-Ala carboxypeptidase